MEEERLAVKVTTLMKSHWLRTFVTTLPQLVIPTQTSGCQEIEIQEIRLAFFMCDNLIVKIFAIQDY